MSMSPQHLGILRSILDGGAEMPRRYQNPKLEKREDVARPYWFVRVSVPMITSDGRKSQRRRRPLGFCDEVNQKEAMKIRGEVLKVVNSGRDILRAQIPFRDLVGRYMEARLPLLGVGTQSRYQSQIDNHILPAFGRLKLFEIQRSDIELWLASLQGKLSWWSRNGLRGVMSAIFSAATDWGLWDGDNPTRRIRLGRKIEARELSNKEPLTVEQFQSILAVVEEPVRFMVLILALTGLRVSEVLGLRWKHINFDLGTLSVEQRWYRGDLDIPKSKRGARRLQLGPLVDEFRRRYPGPHAADWYVFLGDDRKTPPDERDLLRYELRPALKRLGLYYPGFGWHQFRRNNITFRQYAGATPLEAQAAAGHASADMTMHYTLRSSDREREQIQRIFEMYLGRSIGPKQ